MYNISQLWHVMWIFILFFLRFSCFVNDFFSYIFGSLWKCRCEGACVRNNCQVKSSTVSPMVQKFLNVWCKNIQCYTNTCVCEAYLSVDICKRVNSPVLRFDLCSLSNLFLRNAYFIKVNLYIFVLIAKSMNCHSTWCIFHNVLTLTEYIFFHGISGIPLKIEQKMFRKMIWCSISKS